MGRAPCCDKASVKRGPWSPDEDAILKTYLEKNGTGNNWISLPQKAGLKRCGKSCRLRWLNYLRPDIRHGAFTEEEDNIILTLYSNIGSRWSVIANRLDGRTDNDVKNYFNTKLKKRLMPVTAATTTSTFSDLSYLQQPTTYPHPHLFIKTEEDYSQNGELVHASQHSGFGYNQDPHKQFWELFTQYPEMSHYQDGAMVYPSVEEGTASAASSSTTNVENGSSGSYGNWGVTGAAAMDEWYLPELEFGMLQQGLGGGEAAAETKSLGFYNVSHTHRY